MIEAIEKIYETEEKIQALKHEKGNSQNGNETLLFKTLLEKAMNKNSKTQLASDRLSQVPVSGVFIPKTTGERRIITKKKDSIIAAYGATMG